MSNSNQFDAIVIGSGIGGLTVAALLSKLNKKKVLILEQHFVIGGFTHEFKRIHKFKWDVGLHYVGNMEKGEIGRAVFDYITDGKLQWHKMPESFEKFVYPDFTFEEFADPQKYKADLIQRFPKEKQAIERYFFELKTIAITANLPTFLNPLLKLIFPSLGKIHRQTTKEYFDQNFLDVKLKALLASQWGTYGLPPSKSSFATHAMVIYSFLTGGWYPVGGASEIAKHIMPVIERNGGKALTKSQVTEIIIDKGIAKGVKVQKSHVSQAPVEEYYAPIIISDAGAFNTYTKLIPENDLIADYREEIKSFPKGSSAITLYLGFKESPEKLGFRGENHWIYTSYEHDKAFQEQKAKPDQVINSCYLSFASLKDPTATAHTAQAIIFVDYDFFSQWHKQSWKKREETYYDLKEKITQNILNFVESRYPGFKELIEYKELSTPVTLEYFNQSDRGAIYGIPAIPERLGKKWSNPKTPIKNLYLTGTDVMSLGIMGAMMGGVKTVGILKGSFGFFNIMSKCIQESSKAEKTADVVDCDSEALLQSADRIISESSNRELTHR